MAAPRMTTAAIDEPLRLGGDPEATTRAVALLRDLTPTGRRVRWRGRVAGPIDLSLLHHLPPPTDLDRDGTAATGSAGDGSAGDAGAADIGQAVEAWVRSHGFGSCYYRMGPGFLQVKDARDPARPVRTVLDDAELIETFTTCLTPTPARHLDAAALGDLVRRRLVLLADGVAVTLPYRLTRWPVPFLAV